MNDEDDPIEEKLSAMTQPLGAKQLYESRTILIMGEISSMVAERVTSQLLTLSAQSVEPIRVFIHSQGGDPQAAVKFSDHSRHLSPFDPMLFAMLGARAIALVRMKRFDDAADWGVKAAARPNAHAHILAIAAYSLALAGRLDEARAHAAEISRRFPGYRIDDFMKAMQFDAEGAALFGEAAKRVASS